MKGGEYNMTILQKVGAGVATGSLFLSLATSAFAANSVTISGNGTNSHNTVKIKNVKKVTVSQTNVSSVVNGVSTTNSTGGNKANGNTGGDVTVTSGDATSTVTITNNGNTNGAIVPTCGCENPGDTTIGITGNGEKSHNKVTVTNKDITTVSQSNVSETSTSVVISNSTGGNKANNNTGGSVDVTSGDASSTVTVTNEGGTNALNPSI